MMSMKNSGAARRKPGSKRLGLGRSSPASSSTKLSAVFAPRAPPLRQQRAPFLSAAFQIWLSGACLGKWSRFYAREWRTKKSRFEGEMAFRSAPSSRSRSFIISVLPLPAGPREAKTLPYKDTPLFSQLLLSLPRACLGETAILRTEKWRFLPYLCLGAKVVPILLVSDPW